MRTYRVRNECATAIDKIDAREAAKYLFNLLSQACVSLLILPNEFRCFIYHLLLAGAPLLDNICKQASRDLIGTWSTTSPQSWFTLCI
jgi:hypothetical protein